MRRIIPSNSRAVQLYLSEAKTKIEDYKIVPKIMKLILYWNSLSESDLSLALDSADNQLHQIFIRCEKNFREIRASLVSCSTELSELSLK